MAEATMDAVSATAALFGVAKAMSADDAADDTAFERVAVNGWGCCFAPADPHGDVTSNTQDHRIR